MNLISDEAEIANMNRGTIYYIDKEKERIAIRKQFVDRNRIRQNFTLEYDVREVKMQEDGEISSDFLEKINEEAQTMDVTEREALAYNVCQQIVKNRNSWDWDM